MSYSSPLHVQTMNCSAGDSAAYERRGPALDDIVIVSALRTPITKVAALAIASSVSSIPYLISKLSVEYADLWSLFTASDLCTMMCYQ